MIVSHLRVSDGISLIHHGHTLGQQQGGQQIALLFGAQRLDVGIVGGTLRSTIPAEIIVIAVAIVLAIVFVVLVVITHQILQREAVVGSYKIDAGVGTTATVSVEIARAGNAIREVSHEPAVPFPVGTHRVAIAIVPFRPAHGEVSHLIASFAEVPRFGNQLHLREHGILMNDVEERNEKNDYL